jgi:hypothetical protein
MEKVRDSGAQCAAPPAICGHHTWSTSSIYGRDICSMNRCVSENAKLGIEARKFIFGVLMGGCVCLCLCVCVCVHIVCVCTFFSESGAASKGVWHRSPRHGETVEETQHRVQCCRHEAATDRRLRNGIHHLSSVRARNISCSPVLPCKHCDISSISMPLPCS